MIEELLADEPTLSGVRIREELEKRGSGLRDHFQLVSAVEAMCGAKRDEVASAHAMLANKLDAFQTIALKSLGEPADVLHNVEWQKMMIERQPKLKDLRTTKDLHAVSEQFVTAFETGRVGPDDFPGLVEETFEALAEIVNAVRVGEHLERMRAAIGSVASLQNAHREFLIATEESLG